MAEIQIMIVEDEKIVSRDIENMLERKGRKIYLSGGYIYE